MSELKPDGENKNGKGIGEKINVSEAAGKNSSKIINTDVTAGFALAFLQNNPSSVLVDVRTPREWKADYIADPTTFGNRLMLVEYPVFPEFVSRVIPIRTFEDFQADFLSQSRKVGLNEQDFPAIDFFFICRSGGRSLGATEFAMDKLNCKKSHNVAGGFESWKKANLPWREYHEE